MPRPEKPSEGAMLSATGELMDAKFHEEQMGLTEEMDRKLSELIQTLSEGLLEDQAARFEPVSASFARKVYQGLLRRFPDSPRRPAWEEKIRTMGEQ